MAKDWPGITDKAAFCAWMTHRQTGKWPSEKAATGDVALNLPIAKYDSEKGIVTGWAALSSTDGEPVVDFHNDLLLVSELEKAAHALVIDGGAGKAGEMHEGRVGDVIESMVLSKEKAAALGLGDVKTEGWIVSMKLRDGGAIERAKDGSRSELSIHGVAKKIPVGERDGQTINALVDLSVDEISIVDHGASGNDKALPKIVIAKRRVIEPEPNKGLGARFISKVKEIFSKGSTMNLDDVLAKLSEEERSVVLAALEAAAKKPEEPVAAAAPAPEVKPPEMSPDEQAKVIKSLPEEVRKQLEIGKQAAEEIAKLRKELDEKNEREEIAKFKTKADALKFLAGKSTAEIAKALRAIYKAVKPEEYETIEKLLANANEAVKGSSLFVDAGVRGDEADLSAFGKIQTIAKKMREADPKLTKEQAVSKAMHENQELFAEYRKEMHEGNGETA